VRVAFAGSPEAALPSLRALAGAHEVALVVSQPDRPKGRSRRPVPTPVAEEAGRLGLPLVTPASISAPEEVERLSASGAEALCVVAYGQILRQPVLDLFPCVNVHFSLLPEYRGAAPVERAIMDGRASTGITIMLMDPGMDTGPVIAREEVAIAPDEDAGTLTGRLAEIGAPMLVAALDRLAAGTLSATPQDEEGASLAPRITAADRPLDLERPARVLADRVRALSPHVGATVELGGDRLIVWRATPAEAPGAPVRAEDGRLVLAAADGGLELLEVQPPGRGRMAAADFLRGRRGPLAGGGA
jgi:methionyl-tRNA formyltransferase